MTPSKREPPRNVRSRPSSPPPAAAADSPAPPEVGKTTPPPRSEPPVAPPKAPLSERMPRVHKALTGAKIVVGLAIVTSASVGVAWGAKRYMTTSPRFAVKTIEIDGAERKTPEEIAAIGSLHIGDNIFSVDLDVARRKIEDDPWVKSATVTRKLPGSVMVVVVEHEPAALVSIEDKLFLAGNDGTVFKEVGPDDPLDLPVITGIRTEEVKTDREGVKKDVQRALDVANEIEKSAIAKRYPLQEVHLEKDGTIDAVVGTDGIALHLGVGPYRGKLEQAERVFSELGKRKTEPAIVFLDNEASPDKVVVRMR